MNATKILFAYPTRIKLICLIAMLGSLQFLTANPLRLPLYPEGAIPNYKDVGEKEVQETGNIMRISKVQEPDITVYLPEGRNASGDAVIICPGGGYRILAYHWEGTDIARYWASRGVAAIVLKYRLPTSESQIVPRLSPLQDAQRAMRLVRLHAEEWNINPSRIGIMGFSAGGHLASTLSTHFDAGNPSAEDPVEQVSCRPDFSVLVYPVISFTSASTHSGSRKNLIGEDPGEALMRYYSNELQVTKDTPPAVLIHATDDTAVPVENSILYYTALKDNGITAALHIYPYGGHGFSLAANDPYLSGWMERCVEWLRALPAE